MNRREFLLTTSSVVGLATAGCLGGPDVDMDPEDPNPQDSEVGLPPKNVVDNTDVPKPSYDIDDFEVHNSEGTIVKMVPLDVARYWHSERKARFVDARTQSQYDRNHVDGAVFSPAPEGNTEDDLTTVKSTDRIVTYCTCPHLLAGLRAANLLEEGHKGAFMLENGFRPWVENEYPIQSTTEPNNTDFEDDYSNIDGNGE